MMQFIRTIILGVKQGAIAAWYDMRWYICIMGGVLIVYLAYCAIRDFLHKRK